MSAYVTAQESRVGLVFTRTHSALFFRLCRNLVREIASYFGSSAFLPRFKGQEISVLNLEKGSRKTQIVDLNTNWESINCLLDWRTVFLVSHKEHCCRVDLITFQITKAAPMHNPRENPGAVHVSGVVYVFGGKRHDLLTHSEKYRLNDDQWSDLPPLPTPKYAFTPCYFEGQIYMPEVNSCLHSFDIFNITREDYRSLAFKIQCDTNGCVSFIIGQELYLLTMKQHCLKWNLRELEAPPTVSEVQLHDSNNAYSGCSPIFFMGSVYWTNYLYDKTVIFNPSTQLLSEELNNK